jgi:uncharacterized membrane protein
MSDNDLLPDRNQNGYLAAKLARLEHMLAEQGHMLAEQAARLRVAEQRLGIEQPTSTARPFGQGRAPAAKEPSSAPRASAPPQLSVTDATTEQSMHAPAPPSITAETDEQRAPVGSVPAAHEPTARAASPTPDWRAGATQAAQQQHAAHSAHAASAATPAPAAAAVAKAWGDLESLIGGRWFNWLGIIAVIVGTSFFLKYAFDRQWIGPTGRVLLGSVAGCALLALAERLRLRGYQAYAHVLSGGGIVILYLSVYASFDFYHLVGQPIAFALMALVTATAVILAARYDAYAIAVLGLVGGFMTPKLLAANVDNEVGLFGYVALLNAGVLALAYFKRWRSLNYLAFAATWIMFAGWAIIFYKPAKLWLTLFFLTLFFVMFAALAIIHNVLKQRPARWFDVSLVLMNATLYFATSYLLLEDYRTQVANAFAPQGPHALLLAVFFGLLYFIARQRHRADKFLTYTYVALAITFLTMAIAIQTDQQWVTIGWAVEALMLTWVGLRAEEDAPRFAALPVFAVAVMHWFLVDVQTFGYQPLYQPDAVFHPLLNKRAISCAVLVGVCAGVVYLYRRYAERVQTDDRDILTTLFILVGNALALTLLTLDLSDYFRQAMTQARGANESTDALANTHVFALTALWTIYATLALAVGLLRRLQALRFAALAVLGFVVGKLLTVDAFYYSASWHAPIGNLTFISFALVVLALAYSVRAYARAEHVAESERTVALAVLITGANVLALIGLSLEAMGCFNRAKALAWALPDAWHEAARVENNKQLVLSTIWTIYASVAFVLGLHRKRVAVRYGALILLALAGAKILFVDASYYNATWHAPLFNQTAAAFTLFILALWLVAHLYARAGESVAAEAARVVPFVTVIGNVFALAGLSLETSGYFATQRRAGLIAAGEIRDLRLAQQLSLSVLWALYGGALLVFGLVRRNRVLRLMALLLLGLTTAKVFFVDLSSLDKVYRIISFIVLGAILLAVSFLYQQRHERAAKAEGS